MSYLCVNYNVICKTLPKNLKALHPENQEYLRENRWPPVWYLKDFDYYQRCMNEMNRECKPGNRGKIRDESDGCMCFSGGKCIKSFCAYTPGSLHIYSILKNQRENSFSIHKNIKYTHT